MAEPGILLFGLIAANAARASSHLAFALL